ncbi:hypothetical protein ACIBAH_27370 [Streptomyces sp. NPDC051445]|uniref:hypothetical protein n=1 Tax=Streptomyces sp. NPDC051445 TaxID=3365653 RepID=UPI00379FB891
MTSSLLRGRRRRATSHISVRVAHAVLGGAVGVVWLVLPGMTSGDDAPVAIKNPAHGARAAAAEDDERSTVDLVLPLVAVGAAGAVAGYGYVRRVRRARVRTTPGATGSPPPRMSPPLTAPDGQACAALVEADNRVRAARDELGFAQALCPAEDLEDVRRAVREAETELAAAFRMRQRYDEGVPAEEDARRHALAGIVGRCDEVGHRLDAVSDGFGRLRGLDRGMGEALAVAEGRFRELAGRTGASEAVLAELRARYAPTATASVTGSVEQAKDRLLFATVRLNRARQSADAGRPEPAVRHLRAAEGAVNQAAVFLEGVDRLAAELKEAERTVPAALTGAEAELARARQQPSPPPTPSLPPGPRADAPHTGGPHTRGPHTDREDGHRPTPDPTGPAPADPSQVEPRPGATAHASDVDRPTPRPADPHPAEPSRPSAQPSDRHPPTPRPTDPTPAQPHPTPSPHASDMDRPTPRPADPHSGPSPQPSGRHRRTPHPVGPSPVPAPGPVSAHLTAEARAVAVAHADAVLGSVRQELTGGRAWDPFEVLRRVVRAAAPVASGRAGVLPAAALITARTSTAAAADFVATHRGVVGAAARTRLAEAERLLATGDPADRPPADIFALEARELAELDVRAHGNPYAGAEGTAGTGGAVLGGIVPAEDPENGTPAGFDGGAGPARTLQAPEPG